jgi:DNA-binding response OmpR family regulator
MADRVLTVADDPRVAVRVGEALVGEPLVLEGCPVSLALQNAGRRTPDLIVLDLPPIPAGWQLVHHLRAQSDVPLILLVTDAADNERIEGLERGADDCLGRSFSAVELRARVRLVLRRSHKAALAAIRVHNLRLDPVRQEARLEETPLRLRRHEFAVLLVLARQPGTVFSRERLVELTHTAGGRAARPDTIDVYASRLRRKLAGSGLTIRAVRGVGYKLVVQPGGND